MLTVTQRNQKIRLANETLPNLQVQTLFSDLVLAL